MFSPYLFLPFRNGFTCFVDVIIGIGDIAAASEIVCVSVVAITSSAAGYGENLSETQTQTN